MLKIRLSLGGAKKRPVYKIVIADSRFPRDGRFIEKVGFFNPLLPKEKKERINLEVDRIKHWISKGAKPTLRVSRILGEAEVLPMPPKGNNPLKAIPKKERKASKEKEEPKAEAKKEEPKAEAKKEEPKAEAKKEEPKK
jgi:small subunit ribosomal protein S16